MATVLSAGTSAIAIAGLIIGSVALSQSTNSIKTSGATSNINLGGFALDEVGYVNLTTQSNAPTLPTFGTSNFYSTGPGNLTQITDTGSIFVFGATGGDFLPRDGSLPMIGNLDMNDFNINNVSLLNMSGNIDLHNFAMNNVSVLNMTGNINNCNLLTMNGNIQLNNNPLLDVSMITTASVSTNILIGFGLSSVSNNNILIGPNNTNQASHTLLLGQFNQQFGVASAHAVVVGNNNAVTAQNSYILGDTNNANGNNNGLWGSGNTTNATDCYVVGTNTANNNANSFLFGSNFNNVYTTNTVCDLGSQTNPWQNLWLSQNCFVNGFKVPVSVWSSTLTTSLVTMNSGSFQDFIGNAAVVGSLTYPGPLSAGCVMVTEITFSVNVPSRVANDSFEVRWSYNSDLTTVFTGLIGFPANAVTNASGTIRLVTKVINSTTCSMYQSCFLPTVTNAFAPASKNVTLSFPSILNLTGVWNNPDTINPSTFTQIQAFSTMIFFT